MADTAHHERPLPQPTAETAPYWDAASAGRLVIQHCSVCGRHQFYPRAFCTHCLDQALEWVPATGRGRIYSYTICRIAVAPAFEARLPYVVAMIDLDEGVRMLANIVESDVDRIAIGARVAVRFEQVNEACTLPQFALVEAEGN